MTYLSPLFKKLIEQYDSQCESVYPAGLPTNSKCIDKKLQEIQGYSGDRIFLTNQLLQEQEKYGCSDETAHSITQLKQIESGVVVTGQQPNILGGPMMVIHKALTAIELAKKISLDNKVPVVPVFWIAGDDSDLHECNYAEDLTHSKVYRLDFTHAQSLIQMSHRLLDTDRHNDLMRFLEKISPESSFKSLIQPGESITVTFGKMIQSLLGHTGLILVDGASSLVQSMGRNVLNRCVKDHAEIEATLIEGEKKLKILGEQSPVEIRSDVIRAFEITMGERERVKATDSVNAHQLSHDVLSRPIVCDSIFPVVAHVLGPSELRYFGVLAPVYRFFGVPFPMVYPRCHATIGFSDFTTLAQQLGVPVDTLPNLRLSDMIHLLGMNKLSEKHLTEPLLNINQRMIVEIGALTKSNAIEKSLNHHIQILHEKIHKKLSKKIVSEDTELNKQVHFVYNWFAHTRKQERFLLWPTLERFISFDSYCSKIKPLELKHQNIELEVPWKQ